MTQLLITIPEEGDLGPAMKALSPMQRNFIYALVETGGNPTNAAAAAGYCQDNQDPEAKRRNLSSIGSQLMRKPGIVAAIQEESKKRLLTGGYLAVQKLLDLMDHPTPSISLRATNSMLDRIGMGVTSEHKVVVEHTRTDQEIIARIKELATAKGLDPQLFLGRKAAEPIDAEFTPVDDLGDILA
jgi:phage terminase small subunit